MLGTEKRTLLNHKTPVRNIFNYEIGSDGHKII